MKKVLFGAAAAFIAVTVGACTQNGMNSNKVVVTGQPVVIQKTGNTYVVPSNAVMSRDGFYYVQVNNRQKVCYPTRQSNLSRLNAVTLNVNVGGTMTQWSCYDVSPDYFVVRR